LVFKIFGLNTQILFSTFHICILPFTYCLVFSLVCVDDRQLNKMWYNRLSHPNSHVLSTLFKYDSLGNKISPVSFDCTTCKLGKSKTLPFPHNASQTNNYFNIIHSDVWGISPIVSHVGYKYFVTFIDDYSRFTWVYFLWSKAKVFFVFQRFISLLKTQFSAHIKILRSYFGGEYLSNAFQSFLQNEGIISRRSCPSTPQQNDVAKRKNYHLLDVVLTLLLESSIPPCFLCEALSTIVHLINGDHLPLYIMFLLSIIFWIFSFLL